MSTRVSRLRRWGPYLLEALWRRSLTYVTPLPKDPLITDFLCMYTWCHRLHTWRHEWSWRVEMWLRCHWIILDSFFQKTTITSPPNKRTVQPIRDAEATVVSRGDAEATVVSRGLNLSNFKLVAESQLSTSLWYRYQYWLSDIWAHSENCSFLLLISRSTPVNCWKANIVMQLADTGKRSSSYL